MRIVWRRGWPDPSQAELCVVPSGDEAALDVMTRRGQVIIVHETAPHHVGCAIAELTTMECYALPVHWAQTIEPDRPIAATKELPHG